MNEPLIDRLKRHLLTEERKAKGDVEIITSKRGGYEVRAKQIPTDFYYNARLITGEERRAANRLHNDFMLSGQTTRMIANLEAIAVKSQTSLTDRQMDALARWRDAIEAIHGDTGRKMAIDVCCYGYYLKERDYPHFKNINQKMAKFHEAMEDLITHYHPEKH